MTGDIYHVYPLNDLHPHQTDGFTCWCQPVVKGESGGHVVIHNALDGRESQDVTRRLDS